MLEDITIERYKSLFHVSVKLEPLTVLIGPNGSGKSNICEAILFLSKLLEWIAQQNKPNVSLNLGAVRAIIRNVFGDINPASKFWRGEEKGMKFSIGMRDNVYVSRSVTAPSEFVELPERIIIENLKTVKIYDFSATLLAQRTGPTRSMERSGQGIAYALADILLNDRTKFDELEKRFIELVPNIARIHLERQAENNQFSLLLGDRHSDYKIPATDISDGTLRLLAFLTAIYEVESPQIICFEEPENGVHPWLLNKLVELLTIVTTEGIRGEPIQVIVTTHSPAFLDLVDPRQVRAVELDAAGKTKLYELPLEQARFQKALDAFDGSLGELWFVNMFGGNPE